MTTEQQLAEIRQRSYTAKRHADDLSPAWASYVSDTTFLLAELDAARARAAAHAAELAAKDAEIARLRAQVEEDAHLWSIVELYRSDPMAMADALWRMREELGRLRAEKD